MKVRTGLLNATQGAEALETSRKSYYKWENRGLSAMLECLEDREAGRLELQNKIEQLKQEKDLLEKRI